MVARVARQLDNERHFEVNQTRGHLRDVAVPILHLGGCA